MTAALFITLQARFQLAGEWVIGGVEAKGFSYVFVLLALESLVRNRWGRVWLLLGAASAFHVLVGGWSAIAAAGVWLCDSGHRPALRAMAPALAAGLGLSFLGLVPALALTWGVPAEVASRASQIYVLVRLPHHLAPQTFPTAAIGMHLLLAVVCGVIYRRLPVSPGEQRLRLFVLAAVLLAVAGLIVAWVTAAEPSLAARLLRYYWFRLTDVMLPLGTALAWVRYGQWLARRPGQSGRWWLFAAASLALLHLGAAGLGNAGLLPGAAVSSHDIAWREACDCVRARTPRDARFLTPRLASTFKWYAERSEVVTWKDIPQDAAGIVEWWRRMEDLHAEGQPGDRSYRRLSSLAEHRPQRLSQLGRQYNAGYALTRSDPPLDLPVEYRNAWYTVYRLRES